MSDGKKCKCGTLYVVATPIGNLEDITLRAVRILGQVDLIAAEDTRHTRKLLSHLAISKPLVSYYKDREAARTEKIVEELRSGRDVALVSDAGTPAISDPGAILVAQCHENSIPVVPVPGPSSLVAALSVSGFMQPSFTFLGFLPSKKNQRMKALTAHAQDETVTVFYESPRRICAALAECREVLGERDVFVGREITKLHEEFLQGSLSDVLKILESRSQVKGELVVLIAPSQRVQPSAPEDLPGLLSWYRDNSALSMKDAVKKISGDLNLSRSRVYEKALHIWAKK
ncbi:MAG: 16S rRNA (cytidine(1402)-2'-O)-methyltransferase [Deltaproteobacteria bacterium]|nr:16S rRNA (cytidine(1402)-2'-O)-methyltransferase [Deltaproteobacteria bacterium]